MAWLSFQMPLVSASESEDAKGEDLPAAGPALPFILLAVEALPLAELVAPAAAEPCCPSKRFDWRRNLRRHVDMRRAWPP